jgi:MFS superfamily sulfate permease-like transporter
MLTRIFPFLEWLKNYRVQYFKTDLLAGLTVALVLIPQSMAYAQLAGLPSFYGLYAALVPPLIAALFGSSRQLATGPVAVVSLMTAVALEPLATVGSQGYIAYAILLAFMVGAFQLCLGVLRLGVVVNFLSHPVIHGFTNAAALIIATSQLPKLLGVYVDKADLHYQTILDFLRAAAHYIHWPTLLMGVLAFSIMYTLKRFAPRIPNVLVAVVVTTTISWSTGFERDAHVDMGHLQSPPARELITENNRITEAIRSLASKRSEGNRVLERARGDRDPVAEINARRDMDIVQVQIDRLKAKGATVRKDIRKLLLVEAKPGSSPLTLYALEDAAGAGPNSGRIWRIRVGSGPFAIDRVPVSAGGQVVGAVPRGLPTLTLPTLDMNAIRTLLPLAVIIALLGFMEAVSIARAMAAKTGQRIDPNQELIGQGLGNIVGSFARSYPTAGSFSRSAVNLQSGACSGLSSVITSLAMVVVLLFFTPLLYHLPQAVLAAIIMMAVMGLINVKGFFHAWQAQWYDGIISVICFICTLVFAPHLDKGIFIGVGLSLLVFLYKSMRPTVVDLSLGFDEALHDAVAFGLEECKYIDMVRFDGPLFFANASYLEDQIRQRRIKKKELKHIIIVSNGINDIDASGQEALSFIVDRVRSAGMDISLSGVHGSVMQVLERTHLLAKIGEDHIYPTMKRAIKAVHKKTHLGGREKSCPLTNVILASRGTAEKEV